MIFIRLWVFLYTYFICDNFTVTIFMYFIKLNNKKAILKDGLFMSLYIKSLGLDNDTFYFFN